MSLPNICTVLNIHSSIMILKKLLNLFAYFNELTVHDQQICIRQLQYQFKNYVKRLKAKHDEEKFSTISVPSSEWIRLQFWPKNIYTKTAIQYTGRFNISYKVQRRLLRKSHPDAHYCAALFRYTSLFAIKSRNFTCFISADDKHKVPIGESVETSTGVRNKALKLH
ncbi:hypothetical protein RhiirA4_451634 [Rhizophagus irregularis]|uniref:Uncharacterized protein n=1 Tax=Rhizophagus irregularis TaxID=588596 RepID=A0A2I1FWC2_9GLOM|nr:hypothetical protein RhiirA4_451634 [Rhizophagus irregularis]